MNDRLQAAVIIMAALIKKHSGSINGPKAERIAQETMTLLNELEKQLKTDG